MGRESHAGELSWSASLPSAIADEDKSDDGKTDDETNSDDCANTYRGRAYDEKATARHRAKSEDSTVCCYRKGGHMPRRTPVDVE